MTALFERTFGASPERVTRTPGRVNLLGEWTDFSGGLVLPMALPLQVTVAASRNGDDEDVIVSEQFEGTCRFGLTDPTQRHWADYVRGGLQAARAQLGIETGYNIALSSEVPHGSGLSTSAAVCVGTLRAALGQGADPVGIAVTARRVENEFIGVPCGIMDQMAVALAEPGKVLALETGSLEHELIDLPAGWHVAVIHSGVSRELADGRYAERRAEIMAAARALGAEQLCSTDMAAIASLDDTLKRRARHVISEDIRTRAALACLKAGDLQGFAAHMNEGHDSIRDDFEITVPAVDALVSDAIRFGAVAARQTGGGFGGCVVALLEAGRETEWWAKLSARHPKARLVV